MSEQQQNVVDITKDYYDSKDADEFYHNVWGGEDIHIGIYDPKEISIGDASRQTVEMMANELSITKDTKILDIGSGYGGAARFIAKKYGCHITCFNLSKAENARNREKNKAQGLDNCIDVVEGNFEDLTFPDDSFDVVWSEDAILHSGNKKKVLSEVYRVLKKGGDFVFTDPMQADDCPKDVLQPVLDRIHLDSLGSFGLYEKIAQEVGLTKKNIIDLSHYLPIHYGRVKDELTSRYDEVTKFSSKEYVDRMIVGLTHWVNAGNNGYLTWGIIHFTK